MRPVVLLLLTLFLGFPGMAQDQNAPSPIIFIYDASGSMWGQMQGKTKMVIASEVLSASIHKLPENQKIGFVAYGHRKKGDCKDVEFMVDVSNGTKSQVNTALQGIKPLGMTPLAYSATQVIDKLRASKTKATIILVTDGIESCDGNICDVVIAAKKEGIDFRLHIIGFGLKAGETEQLKCAANAGDGQYYDAADASALGDVLSEATSETIDKKAGNFGVHAVKNGKPIDAYVKAFKAGTKDEAGTLRTYGETRYMYLPAGMYDLEAFPLGSDVNGIVLKGQESFDDKKAERTISFDGGKLGVTTTNNEANWDCMVKLLDQNGKVVASVRTYQEPKEVEVHPGTYKISIQALAMEGINTYTEIENVTIAAGEITPMAYNFETGTAFIDAKGEGKSIDSVVTVHEVTSGKNVAGSRTYDRGANFLLNPGTYKVKVAPLGNFKDRKAQTFSIEVKKGEALSKTVNF
jgi:Ca-activated chloride channel family protein